MIIAKLLMMEFDIVNTEQKDEKKLNTISELKRLLRKIDFNVEVVPLEDEDRLLKLFSSLKNNPLSLQEKEVIKELVNY